MRYHAYWTLAAALVATSTTGCLSSLREEVPTVESERIADDVDVAPELSTAGRRFRRMHLDQLSASMSRVSDGIGWTEVGPEGEYDVFQRLAGSLGKPDYLDSTIEETSPGLLFQKFLDDAASSVCERWILREKNLDMEDRSLLTHVELTDFPGEADDAIRENLRAMFLRFHGRQVEASDPVLDPWLRMLGTLAQGEDDMSKPWQVTCVAMFTSPDFYTY